MKRKTNLFYTTGPDSKFLTFSNYTEYLTGNFLSTDTKLFPSTFLCLYVKEFDKDIQGDQAIENKKVFIKNYLVEYYENKLAACREYCLKTDKSIEKNIYPLSYLFETLDKYLFEECGKDKTDYTIEYVGDISEQDYDGTYTDTICIVDMNHYKRGNLDSVDSNLYSQSKVYTDHVNNVTLFGWTQDELQNFETYQDSVPKFESSENNCYLLNPFYKSIHVNTVEQSADKLKFNVIIPLFDIVNINYKTNNSIIDNYDIDIELSHNTNNNYTINLPLGIWINVNPITLNKDIDTNYFPSWSLVISSQFKPLPYFNGAQNSTTDNNIIKQNISNEFTTFAQILSNQNTLIKTFNELRTSINNLNTRIDKLSNDQKNLGTVSNIDGLHKEIVDYENQMNENFSEFKKEIYRIFDNLTWKTNI